MKIEVGKFYKSSFGHKIRIYATDGKGTSVIHGAYLVEDIRWVPTSWPASGRAGLPGLDIISEWEEPRPRKIAWVHKTSGSVILADEGLEKLALDIDQYIRMPHLDEPEGK